jgi:hypothetical protein
LILMMAVTLSYLLNYHKSLICKKLYFTLMALSRGFKEILQRVGGKWDHRISASRAWFLTFFSDGPPPVALAYLPGKRERAFFEELVKLSDIKKVWDARAILVASPKAINTDGVQLVTNSGVYAVLDGDNADLEAALAGRDVSEVNGVTQAKLLGKRSRSVSQECRTLELDLLSKRWMTLRELEEQLRWRFDARTVKTQARSLQRGGKLCVCGRTVSGEGLLGTPDGRYKVRPDLSAPTARTLLSREILYLLRLGMKPLNYRDISERLGINAHVVIATMRGLAKEGSVEKKGDGWMLKARHQDAETKGNKAVGKA